VCCLVLAAHVGSSLAAFPNAMAYANEAWGGPANVHKLLSDSNSDWAQQLFQVRAWQQRHPGEECWFAYFAYPEVKPETYGISCHHLPTVDTYWQGGADNVPTVLEGTVIVSAGDLSGCEWPAASLNPYDAFRSVKPEETIDHAVMIYRGRFDLSQAAALSRAQNATEAVGKGDAAGALALADESVAIDPSSIMGHEARGDALAAMGRKEEARQEWDTALREARKLEPGAQPMFVPDLESKLNK
jgi:tetratricopeptide (TPR) repeat protein